MPTFWVIDGHMSLRQEISLGVGALGSFTELFMNNLPPGSNYLLESPDSGLDWRGRNIRDIPAFLHHKGTLTLPEGVAGKS